MTEEEIPQTLAWQLWNSGLDHAPVMKEPGLMIMSGGSLVGKSTLLKKHKNGGKKATGIDLGNFDDYLLINPHLIRGLYPQLNQESSSDPEKSSESKEKSRHPEKSPGNIDFYCQVRDEMVLECLKRGISVVLDEHCDSARQITALLDKIKAMTDKNAALKDSSQLQVKKVHTRLLGMFAHPRVRGLAFFSAGIRQFSAPNTLSKDFVFAKNTTQAFAASFPILAPLFDHADLYENTDRVYMHIISAMGGKISVFDRGAYNRFLNDKNNFEAIYPHTYDLPEDTTWGRRYKEEGEDSPDRGTGR